MHPKTDHCLTVIEEFRCKFKFTWTQNAKAFSEILQKDTETGVIKTIENKKYQF